MNDSIFSLPFDLSNDIKTTFKGKEMILKGLKLYHGPLTMQYLPYGGIQSVYQGNLVINTYLGYITPSVIEYDGKNFTTEEFVKEYDNLVNQVLPN